MKDEDSQREFFSVRNYYFSFLSSLIYSLHLPFSWFSVFYWLPSRHTTCNSITGQEGQKGKKRKKWREIECILVMHFVSCNEDICPLSLPVSFSSSSSSHPGWKRRSPTSWLFFNKKYTRWSKERKTEGNAKRNSFSLLETLDSFSCCSLSQEPGKKS